MNKTVTIGEILMFLGVYFIIGFIILVLKTAYSNRNPERAKHFAHGMVGYVVFTLALVFWVALLN